MRLGGGASQGTKSAEEAEDNIGVESKAPPDSEVKVGSDHTFIFFDRLRDNVLMPGRGEAQDSCNFLERNLQYNLWFVKPDISCSQMPKWEGLYKTGVHIFANVHYCVRKLMSNNELVAYDDDDYVLSTTKTL